MAHTGRKTARESSEIRASLPQEWVVTELDHRSDARWKQFVESHPDALIYHQTGWLQALEKEYGRRCVILACEDGLGNLLAVLPLMYTQGLPFNVGRQQTSRRLSSLPRTPIAGPLGLDPRATAAVLREAMNRTAGEPGVRLEIKSESPGLDLLAQGLCHTPWRFTYVVDRTQLTAGYESSGNGEKDLSPELRFGNSRRTRRIKWAVNRAMKEGVRVRRAENKSELRAWYNLHLYTLRRNGIPPRPYRFFEGLWDSLAPGEFNLLLAEQDRGGRRRLLAGSFFLQHGRTVSYAFNGCRREEFHLRPNQLLQWHAIRQAFGDARVHKYDLGEVPHGNEQLANFKSRWGAKPVRLHRYYYPAPQSRAEQDSEGQGLVWQFAAGIWRHLPLALTAKLGDSIYSYL